MSDRSRILFLFSDTGGGHRSAAEAVIEALENHYPDCCETVLVDVLKEYAPRPIDRLPEAYPKMVKVPEAWAIGFRLLDGHRRGRALTAAVWPYVRSQVRQLVSEQPADLIVSVHPLLTAPVLKALGDDRPQFITIVTDLVSGHALWYHRQADLTIVPTVEARERAMECGLPPEKVRVIGLPVAERFCQPVGDEQELRRELDWPTDIPMVLVVGGAEGMGPIYETARAIARQQGEFGLAVVAGRNERLKKKLERVDWEVPTKVYGFERRMPMMMQAATLLVTKAGPGTITEALNAGLPMVLYSRIPGQEEGNVDYVSEKAVGVWAPGPQATAAAVRRWLNDKEGLEEAAETCRRIARPRAAVEIAETLIANLDQPASQGDGWGPAAASS
ncbi:MAG: glycosyltransferase [Anaerolineales bacterium]|nr:glycosyltransferase [Anaerolineales bacterium]